MKPSKKPVNKSAAENPFLLTAEKAALALLMAFAAILLSSVFSAASYLAFIAVAYIISASIYTAVYYLKKRLWRR